MEEKRLGFFQALGVTAYCSLVGFLMWNGDRVFGQLPHYLGPVLFLMLFSTSALTCALIVFYKPYKLFFSNKKKEAVNVVFYTAGWLFFFVAILLTIIYFK